ncbi:cytosolic phospholipase A2 gamma-like [Puntigrus tetrazona]|uniref:cytosolic phospholipase A2 gamma-like n=1 Tax=Puntigrus tetrazona TaxID=1606681 RepID=UPI001C89901B|nr:cytosolic phospholipase A2 gamma-like [Puntigrus tetrazona]
MSAFNVQKSGEVRISHSLHPKEKEFVDRRRDAVFRSLQELNIHTSQDEDEVQNIALLASGGGERAMVGLLECLVQLDKAGLLDCILYLSGVSGSTWCMASLYKEPDWSTKLETVKDNIVKRLSGPKVSWGDACEKLKKYHKEKELFSLTDVWAALVVTDYVKEIDEQTLTEEWDHYSKDPFPIYTAIDKQFKQQGDGDPWFEISPYEAGYSLTGAFVDTSSFGSKFENGSKNEMDMLYLQGLCSSAIADEEEIYQIICMKIKDFLHIKKMKMLEETTTDLSSWEVEQCFQVLVDLVDAHLYVRIGEDPSALHRSIAKTLNNLGGGKYQSFSDEKINLNDKQAAKLYMKQYTEHVFNNLSLNFTFWPFDFFKDIFKCLIHWIWGRNYNFIHNMTDKTVPPDLLKSETRDYEDAGLLLNSPYFSVLREERNIDLIISLDFSEGDPFLTIKETADICSAQKPKIPFPEVHIPSKEEKNPKDFYVFKGPNAPTVIHIPLFNVVNCGDDLEAWRNKYGTFQGPYSAEMIKDLMEVAGKNISNNVEKLREQIGAAVGRKEDNEP